jgi:hypothetical protein
MLRTIGRIMVILLVIGLVAGGLYWLGQTNPSILSLGDSLPGLMEEGTRPDRGSRELFERGDATESGLSLDFQQDGMRLHNGEGRLDSGRAWTSILRNILIIAIITLLVTGIQKLFSWISRRRQVRTT